MKPEECEHEVPVKHTCYKCGEHNVSASGSNELLSVDIGLLKEVNDLCQLIVGSPPDATIKGRIESLAFSIGHHPDIIGR